MILSIYTKYGFKEGGKLLHNFGDVDEVRTYEDYHEIVFENHDHPRARIYGKEHIIMILHR